MDFSHSSLVDVAYSIFLVHYLQNHYRLFGRDVGESPDTFDCDFCCFNNLSLIRFTQRCNSALLLLNVLMPVFCDCSAFCHIFGCIYIFWC